jgi:hypothetical protein
MVFFTIKRPILFKKNYSLTQKKIKSKKLDYNPEFSSRSLSPSGSQDESQSYGNCSEYKKKRTAVAWCKNCDIAIFKEIFCSWTSGNSIIDKFIRNTQLNANKNTDHLE